MNARRLSLVLPLLVLTTYTIRLLAEDIPPSGFRDVPPRTIVLPTFTDGDVDELLTTLDGLLAHEKDPTQWETDAGTYLWTFVERLQAGQLTPQQEARVLEHFDQIEQAHPTDAAIVQKERHVLTALTVGKVAPDIAGKDFDGKEFRLSDYRGSVVVLAFSGEWCGACRAEYPYERLLLELYKGRPLTILSVDSDSDLEFAKKAKAARGLAFRSFWDGYAEKNTHGPIASAWGVVGWPTIYVLDEDGVIRFVNLRQEDLLKGVKQLMSEQETKAAAAKPHEGGN